MSENEQDCTEQEEINDFQYAAGDLSLWANTTGGVYLNTSICTSSSGSIVNSAFTNVGYLTATQPSIAASVPAQTITFTNSGTNIITIFGDNGSIDVNHDGTITTKGDINFNEAALVFWKYVSAQAPENKSTIYELKKEIQELEEKILKLKNETMPPLSLKFEGKMIAQTTSESPNVPAFYMTEQELLHTAEKYNTIVSNQPFTEGYHYAPYVPKMQISDDHKKILSDKLFDDAMEILK